ncbi:hypothetical protein DH2020_042863 [Rehmannia glutinosa]|uniref:RNase III domain-containing protein n=1 Tax=Rehmannia glutinosa TaxID=99300 RepID=A0ABR0UMG8_REHGL
MDCRGSVFLLFLLVGLLSSSPQKNHLRWSRSLLKSRHRSQLHWTLSRSRSRNVESMITVCCFSVSYTFTSAGLLRRAMTHASFSEENNKALSILGASVIETSVALQSLIKDVDISAKDLNHMIADVSKVESSCNADGTRLGLQNIVRASRKTNVTAPAVVCGALRAIFGAIAVDAGSSDEARRVFGKIHRGIGSAMTM